MSDNGDSYDSGSDSAKSESGLPVSRRGVLAATGLAGLGLAGSTAVSAQDQDEDDNPSHPKFAVKEHDHSGTYGEASRLGVEAPIESITVNSINTARQNDIVYASEYESLNAAVESTDAESVHVVLPEGVTPLNEPIENIDRDLIIEGKGKNVSTVRSVGASAFYRQEGDAHDQTLLLNGFTLDLNHVPSDEVIVSEGDFGQLLVNEFKGLNMNLEETNDQRGFFEFRVGDVDLVQIDNSEFRFDTIINRHEPKYLLFNGSGQGGPVADGEEQATIDRFVVRNTLNIGERIHLADRPDVNHYIGCRAFIGQFALVSGCNFRQWDQYATFLQGSSEATIKILNNHLQQPGDADIIRTGATEDGTTIHVHGNTIRNALMPSDRAIIVQNTSGATPSTVMVTNNIVEDFHVGLEVTGGHNILIENNSFKNIGHATNPPDFEDDPRFGDDVGSHVAVYVRSRNTSTRDVRISGNIITTPGDERKLGPGIWVLEAAEDWEGGYLVVENNIIVGNDNLRGSDREEAIDLDVETPVIIKRHNEVMDEEGEVIDDGDDGDDGNDGDDGAEEVPDVYLLQPNGNDPITAGPGEGFEITWEVDKACDYRLEYLDEDADQVWGDATVFDGDGAGRVQEEGEYTNTVVTPDETGTYNVRVRVENEAGATGSRGGNAKVIVED